jgi:hypothetical protein
MTDVKFFDDVLAPDAFRALAALLRDADKQRSLYGVSIWQNNDENPFEGRRTYIWSAAPTSELEAMLPAGVTLKNIEQLGDLSICPTASPIDPLFDAMQRKLPEIREQIGAFGQDWIGIVAKAYAYPRGAKANWHTDSGPYSGAFVYYAHEVWERDWGGQFLYQEREQEATRDGSPGHGRFVAPLPNRLLILKAGTLHTVSSVSACAGDHPRLSLAGFFVRPGGVPQLIEQTLRSKRLRQGETA